MKVLQDCTLLQACEYLAFGWEPFSPEDELFCEEERWRPYMRYGDNGIYKDVHPRRQSLYKAREKLIVLFGKGLHCYKKGVQLPPLQLKRCDLTNEPNIQMMLGITFENDYSGGTVRAPYVVVQNFQNPNKNRYIKDVTINFAELKELHDKESQKFVDVYKLSIDTNLYLCCQKNNDKPVKLKTKPMCGTADNYLILKYVMKHPDETLNQEKITKNTGVKFTYEKGINNRLQSILDAIPDVKAAFFDVNAQEIRFRDTVTNRDLEKENKKAPI